MSENNKKFSQRDLDALGEFGAIFKQAAERQNREYEKAIQIYENTFSEHAKREELVTLLTQLYENATDPASKRIITLITLKLDLPLDLITKK